MFNYTYAINTNKLNNPKHQQQKTQSRNWEQRDDNLNSETKGDLAYMHIHVIIC